MVLRSHNKPKGNGNEFVLQLLSCNCGMVVRQDDPRLLHLEPSELVCLGCGAVISDEVLA